MPKMSDQNVNAAHCHVKWQVRKKWCTEQTRNGWFLKPVLGLLIFATGCCKNMCSANLSSIQSLKNGYKEI